MSSSVGVLGSAERPMSTDKGTGLLAVEGMLACTGGIGSVHVGNFMEVNVVILLQFTVKLSLVNLAITFLCTDDEIRGELIPDSPWGHHSS